MLNKKIIALVLIMMLAPIQNANAKTSHHSYKNKGWNNWGDWLGTGVVANQNKSFLSFDNLLIFCDIFCNY